jgi:hypothetical protein
MTALLLRIAGGILVCCITTIGFFTQRPVQATLPAALQGLRQACPSEGFCWQGIMIGQTSLTQARTIIEAIGYEPHFEGLTLSDHAYSYRSATQSPPCLDIYGNLNNVVTAIVLRCIEGVYAGDVLLALGEPAARSSLDGRGEGWLYPHFTVRLRPGWWYVPFAPVESVTTAPPINIREMSAWHGLLPRWVYCERSRPSLLCGR